jgi:hypothetical protein
LNGQSNVNNPEYEIFVSYTRDPDYKFARSLTAFLESFHKIPVPVVRGDERGPQLSPIKVCLDGVTFSLPPAGLQADAGEGSVTFAPSDRSVNPVVESYLAKSRELLVLCSSRTIKSPWVNHEIEWWLAHRDAGSIRLAVTEADYPWSDPASFFPSVIVQHGLHEEICYDLRGFYEKRAREWSKVSDFDSQRVRLAADLNGESAGDVLPLWFREQRHRQRRRFITVTTSAFVLLAAISFGLYQAAETRKERQHAIEQEASRLVAESFEVLERDPSTALMTAFEAKRLHPTGPAVAAIKTAYRVLTFHAMNRREGMQLTGSGPGYLAHRWREGDLFTVFSDDGRYAAIATKRSQSGAKQPGSVYLVDNETLRTTKLTAPEHHTGRRVEYLGFDQSNRYVFVTRQFYLAIYELDGSLVGTYKFSRFTKSPIHLVNGYLASRYIIGADSKGGLWMVDPLTEEKHTIQREWHGDPLVASQLSADGRYAGLVFESGRTGLLAVPESEEQPVLIDLTTEGVLYSGFPGEALGELVIAGEDGLLQIWTITDEGKPELQRTYENTTGTIDWVAVSTDGLTLLTNGVDYTVTLLDKNSGEVLDSMNFANEIDWASMLRMPRKFKVFSGARKLNIGGRQWFASSYGAYLEEDGRVLQITDRFTKIRDIKEAGGTTWILTGESPGPILRVEGYLTHQIPRTLGNVSSVLDLKDRALFATTNGVWQWQDGSFERVRGIERAVRSLKLIGDEIWAVSGGPFQLGPAFRIKGLEATSFPDAEAKVSGIVAGQNAVWLQTGWFFSDPGPAYRVAHNIAEPVPDASTAVHAIRVVDNKIWLLTKSSRTKVVDGPAYRWDGQRALPVPSGDASVSELFDIDGKAWLAYKSGDDITHLGRFVNGDWMAAALGPVSVNQVVKLGGSIWAATDKGAYRLIDDQVLRIPEEGLDVGEIVKRGDTVWLIAGNEAHRVKGERTDRYSAGEHTVRDIVTVNGITWILTSELVFSGPAYRLCGEELQPFEDETAKVDTVQADGENTLVKIMQPDFKIRTETLKPSDLVCE